MSKHILIIEDDPDILSILEIALQLSGYQVSGIPRTQDIFTTIKTYDPDLILTDYMMPGLNGGQICNLLKSREETRDLPVILMSAYHKMAISLAKFSYDAYIPKPFDVNKLIGVIEKLLN
ncbi:two-component system, OmpR family, phosphate regulon response regulator PhoB [Mucilaginibacter pineti]|uniref:Two-component system, OmpR family, phosphate regulon response regulator PhoB n=1 Tax=Mucilaginibacter pineti TaxID=1391627 RepID=A0A1G7HB46_9SPHI|nr:response regulator [Mucilaginibacter pineti]SDE97533.1 two-component system, OmpR family, phosphate regulon response regulator PhoB [Mucilaginibacter pineti]